MNKFICILLISIYATPTITGPLGEKDPTIQQAVTCGRIGYCAGVVTGTAIAIIQELPLSDSILFRVGLGVVGAVSGIVLSSVIQKIKNKHRIQNSPTMEV